MTVDAVILSKCSTREDFGVNEKCVASLIESEPDTSFDIAIIESNQAFPNLGLAYRQPNVRVITPNEPFRFHRFMNIGLDHTRSEWILFSNNDVTFHRGWFSEILKIKQMNPRIQSFCPLDRKAPYIPFEKFRQKPYHIGYRVPIQFVGWCFVTERSVIQEVGRFDEQYGLYFGDNDFVRTLKRSHIVHAMVPSSWVEHQGGYTTGNYDGSDTPQYAEDRERYKRKWGDTRLRSVIYQAMKTVEGWVSLRGDKWT